MTSLIRRTAKIDKVSYRKGLGGNLYIYCLDFYNLQRVCLNIDKSPNSIKSHPKHRVWYIRLKSEKHKKAFQEYLKKDVRPFNGPLAHRVRALDS